MRDRIEAALKSSQADYAEIRIEQRDATTVAFRGKNLETASAVVDTGGIVRCLCRNNGWGVATFNSLDNLPARVEQAYQCARAAHSEQPIELAAVPVTQERITARLDAKHDFRGISMAEKKALTESYNNIMLTLSDKIVDTQTHYGDSFTRLTFASSDGTFIEEERPMVSVVAGAVARDGDNVQSAHETRSGQRGFDFVQGCEQLARTAAQRGAPHRARGRDRGISRHPPLRAGRRSAPRALEGHRPHQ